MEALLKEKHVEFLTKALTTETLPFETGVKLNQKQLDMLKAEAYSKKTPLASPRALKSTF